MLQGQAQGLQTGLVGDQRHMNEPWLVWLSGLSTDLQTKGSPVQFPVKTHAWVVGQVPSRGCERQPHIDVSLPLFLPPSPSI